MKAVRPTPMTSALLISSSVETVVEPYESAVAYNAGTTYGSGVFVYYENYVYQSLQVSNTNHTPSLSPTWWAVVAPTNRWAMFDGTLSNKTVGESPFAVVIEIGQADTLAVMGVVGADITLTVRDGLAGPIIYQQSMALTGDSIGDWWEYFYFDPFLTKVTAVFLDIPLYAAAHATIEVTEVVTETVGASIEIAEVVFGRIYEIGSPAYGATAGIIDYSRVERDDFGAATLVKRAFSKRLSASLLVDNDQLNRVYRFLSEFRATPLLWLLADEDERFEESGVVFGPYRDFDIEIAYPDHSLCRLELNGMN